MCECVCLSVSQDSKCVVCLHMSVCMYMSVQEGKSVLENVHA